MTEKNAFAHKLFLPLNILDFSWWFFDKNEKSHPLFPSNLPQKVEVVSNFLFLKIWLEVCPSPQAERGGGGGVSYTLWFPASYIVNFLIKYCRFLIRYLYAYMCIIPILCVTIIDSFNDWIWSHVLSSS